MGWFSHKPKVLMYSATFGTLGPTTVMDRTAHALKEHGMQVSILGNPLVTEHRYTSHPRRVTLSYEDDNEVEKLARALLREKPAVLILEQIPFVLRSSGRRIMEAVEQVRPQLPGMKVYGLSRDIPYFNGEIDRQWAAETADKLDAILVRGDGDMIDPRQEFSAEQWEHFDGKLHHVGYMVPPLPSTGMNKGGGIVVQLGGGAPNRHQDVMKQVLQTIPQLSPALQQEEWHFYITDYAKKSDFAELNALKDALPDAIGRHIHLHSHSGDYLAHVQKADLVVTRGGMSAVEAVAYGKPAVLIPFASNEEQHRRAMALQAKAPGRVEVLDDAVDAVDTGSTQLVAALERLYPLRRVTPTLPDIHINGHEHAAQGIVDRLHGIDSDFSGRSK